MGDSPDLERSATIYSPIITSSYGAFKVTICASLVELLWRGILKQKGVRVRRWQFHKLNLHRPLPRWLCYLSSLGDVCGTQELESFRHIDKGFGQKSGCISLE